MKRFKLVLFSITLMLSFAIFGQEVETIVSSGLDLSQISTFSDNGKLIAKSSHSELTVWDTKSGRLIKKIKLEATFMIDSIAFDSKNEHVIAYKMASNDKAIVDFYSGEFVIEKGGSFDYTNYDSKKIYKTNWYKISNFFAEKNKGYLNFETCNEDVTIRYRNKSQNYEAHLIEVSLVYKDGFEVVLNDFAIIFGNFCFSRNKRLLYANGVIYDIEKRSVHSTLNAIKYIGTGAMFSYNSHVPVTSGKDNLIEWRFPTNRKVPVKNMANLTKLNDSMVGCLVYDLAAQKSSYQVVNIKTGVKVGEQINFKKNSYQYALDPNGKWLTVKFANTDVHLYNVKTGELVTEFPKVKYTDLICFGENNNLLFLSSDSSSYKMNLTNQQKSPYKIKELDTSKKSYYTFKKVKGHFFKPFIDGTTKVWNEQTGELVHVFKDFMLPGDIYSIVSQDMKLIAFFDSPGNVRVLNFETGVLINKFELDDGMVLSADISFDNKYLLTSTLTGKTKYIDLNSGKELLSLIVTGNEDYLIKSPDNYYYTTKNATDFIHFKKGKEIFTFEQFDLKFNRPDLILAKLDYVDPMLVKAYYKAYLKRLRKMKFTEDMLKNDFHLPRIKIKNLEQMPQITDSSFLDLNLNMDDEKYKLDRINIWVNDVAIYGINGISIRELNTASLDRELHVNLAKGINKIQVSVLNQSGAESYKESFSIKCSKGKDQPDLYLISLGESKFKSAKYDLKYAAKDAGDVKDLLMNSPVYAKVDSKKMINDEVTKESVLKLKEFLSHADINDHVMIFFAGHGVLNNELDYYLATHDMDFNNPSERGLAYEDLEGLLDGINPLKKMILIDACHSGEIDKDELDLIASEQVETGDIQFRSVGNAVKPKLGSQNTAQLTKSLFTDLRKGTGATVISSAGGVEFAMESDEWKNGLFTYCLLNGVKTMNADINQDGEIWLSELKSFIQNKVFELSQGLQRPTSRVENNTLDYRIW
jgi:WD40 repeat protein